jgi:electron transport complex protein RnfG
MSADDSMLETTSAEDVSPALPARKEVPSWRLILTLALVGAIAALCLAFVYEATRPAILANKARVVREAIREVLRDPARVVSLLVTETGLEPEEEVKYVVDARRLDRVFLGFDEKGKPLGFALVGAAYGYGSDPIRIMFGYDAKTGEVIGLKVLEHKETPGIGTKIETEATFTTQFWEPEEAKPGDPPLRAPPLKGVRSDQLDVSDPKQVDMISGATISSRAVIAVINDVVGQVREKLEAYDPGDGE